MPVSLNRKEPAVYIKNFTFIDNILPKKTYIIEKW